MHLFQVKMFISLRQASLVAAAAVLLAIEFKAVNAALTLADRPWLDISRPYEERLQLFMLQLNVTQKYAMVQGDTVVSSLHTHELEEY